MKEISLEFQSDFVVQLNQLSNKQHRRQYSACKHLNNLPLQSARRNNEETTILNNSREDMKIIHKTNQMIEQIQFKNEQLARQTKLFQKKFQRNQIYSALNRYSHRSTMDLKSQQSKDNQRINTSLPPHRINSSTE